MPTPVKRRRTNVSVVQKQMICRHKQDHPQLSLVGLQAWVKSKFDLDLGKTTLFDILKSSEKWLNVETSTLLRQKTCQHPQLEDALYTWFTHVRARKACVNNEMLIAKAKVFGEKLGITDFSYSFGWLTRFKVRKGIQFREQHGEAGSADPEAVAAGREDLRQVLARYNPDDVYNLDETGLFYKLGPNKTLATAPESGQKRSKERITVTLICNASGNDLRKPLVIAKSKRPRCFGKNFNPSLYVEYFHNTKAWMTTVIFQNYLRQLDRDMRLQGRQIILLVDNASSHSTNDLDLTNVEVHYLPPCTTSHIQPLDAGIIRAFKAHYRRQLVSHYIECVEQDTPQTVDLRQALLMVRQGWRAVTAQTVRNCWRHTRILPVDVIAPAPTDDDEEDNIPLNELRTLLHRLDPESQVTANEYVDVDASVEVMEEMSDDHILQAILPVEPSAQEDTYDGPVAEEPIPTPVTARDARQGLVAALHHFENLGNVPVIDKLSDILRELDSSRNAHQSCITAFFKPT